MTHGMGAKMKRFSGPAQAPPLREVREQKRRERDKDAAIADLVEALERAKIPHRFNCCGKGGFTGAAYHPGLIPGECSQACGADAHNAAIDAAIEKAKVRK